MSRGKVSGSDVVQVGMNTVSSVNYLSGNCTKRNLLEQRSRF